MNNLDPSFPDYSIVGTPSGGQEATITFNNNEPDIFGSYWFLNGDVEGWDSPDMRVTMLTKIGSDVDAEGEIPGDLHYRGRSLVMKLSCASPSEVARQNSRLLLAQAANTSACVFTANEDVPKNMSVVRSGNTNQGKLTIVEQGYIPEAAATYDADGVIWGLGPGVTAFLFEATIELYAMDPFKYAVTPIVRDFGSGGDILDIVNNGTYPTMNAVLAFGTGDASLTDGPLDIYTSERAMQLLVPTIPSGAPALGTIPDTLTIDLYNKLIYDQFFGPPPASNYYYLRNMQTPWLRIPTGTSEITTDPFCYPGTLTYYEAYL